MEIFKPGSKVSFGLNDDANKLSYLIEIETKMDGDELLTTATIMSGYLDGNRFVAQFRLQELPFDLTLIKEELLDKEALPSFITKVSERIAVYIANSNNKKIELI